MRTPDLASSVAQQAGFTSTHWSVVLAAGQDASAEKSEALERLCRTYWYPLYAFVRRRGYPQHEAQDLTQSFFERLLDKQYLKAVDRTKGKFRSFLLASLEHFLANEWRRSQAQKRGGNMSFISLDDDSAERHYLQVPGAGLSPEQLFEQQWATALLEHVLANLRAEFVAEGKGELFEQLKVYLTCERQGGYAEMAARLKTTEAGVKMAVSRLRHRYGVLLREEIASTVARPEDIEEELRALFAALAR
jgi:RNA polymerase sigma factor (sigma-70 family)